MRLQLLLSLFLGLISICPCLADGHADVQVKAIPVSSQQLASKKQNLANAVQKPLVHWGTWTDELFDKAKKERKLVILDLEAIWCHWCHVMDQKTYSNADLAKELDAHYIAVKVDQDSRPDLSSRYEDYGWPATIIFNAEGVELAKRAGFVPADEMLPLLKKLSKNPVPEEKSEKSELKCSSEAALSKALHLELMNNHKTYYDDKEGSWQTVQKFLDADCVELALNLAKEGDKRESQMARQTLFAQLSLLDPAWGGMYQYSTDGDWKHPHFEKIMSVQGDNMRIYSLGYALFKDPRFLAAAESIEKYFRKFLMSPDGAFYTSQDADLKEGEHSAGYFKLNDAARRKQGIPRVDKHIYSRENGWAICGLAGLYMATAKTNYLDEAEKAANYIIKNRRLTAREAGGFKHDASDLSGPYLGDTLFMGKAFLSLYQATGNRKWLDDAISAAYFIEGHFKNIDSSSATKNAGYLSSAPSHGSFQKPEPLIDENVVLVRFCNMLSYYSGKVEFKKMAEYAMRYLATPTIAHKHQVLISGILLADNELSSAPAHITIVGSKSDRSALSLFQAANRYPHSYKRVEWFDRKEGKMPNPDTEYPEMPKAAAFACANERCSRPVYKAEDVNELVDKAISSR